MDKEISVCGDEEGSVQRVAFSFLNFLQKLLRNSLDLIFFLMMSPCIVFAKNSSDFGGVSRFSDSVVYSLSVDM